MDSSEAIQDTRERLRRIIIKYLQNHDIQFQNTDFDKLEDIGIDSLGMLDVIFEIEGEFGVQTGEIDGEVLEKITTFDGLATLVDSLRA